jgi:small subunit ribosomal protein S15
MSITAERKQALIKEYGLANGDTGSVEVQCAILTERIKNITGHLNPNKKDFQAKRGLIRLVTQRRKLIAYLQRKDDSRYRNLIQRLGLRK